MTKNVVVQLYNYVESVVHRDNATFRRVFLLFLSDILLLSAAATYIANEVTGQAQQLFNCLTTK